MTHRSFTSPGQDEDITVLHIDDEPDLVDLAATFLEKEDPRLNVIPITSPEEGLERLAETTVDCVVSDYDMPGQSGLDLLRGIRKTDPDLPFILFTGKGSEEIAIVAVRIICPYIVAVERGPPNRDQPRRVAQCTRRS